MNKYELGKLLGKGNFAKVYHARNLQTGQHVAVKVIDKGKIPTGMTEQIKREISVMRLVRHPNVVHLFEVMASKSKIYFIMELARGGELFNRIIAARGGRLKEETARKYFQQLIAAVEFCHSRGVYHRDLKPENLLLDEQGNLKVSDFGLSAIRDDDPTRLLHTTCGTPAYVAPEVVMRRGYDGAKTDVWSCGVVLFVLLAGYLPFHDLNLMELYRKIARGKFKCPNWINPDARKLVTRILDPSPARRITIAGIMSNSWFLKGFKKIETPRSPQGNERRDLLRDVEAAFEDGNKRPAFYNAFDIISLSRGFDLSGLLDGGGRIRERESRFTTRRTAEEIVNKFEEIAVNGGFEARRENLEGREEGRKGQLVIDAEIFEVTPAFHVVEVKKVAGDTLEYVEFCDEGLRPSLKDIVWAWQGNGVEQSA
ncbi:CBL-interacting serine/threonine-protein kinase 20 [Linum grandiflorum]